MAFLKGRLISAVIVTNKMKFHDHDGGIFRSTSFEAGEAPNGYTSSLCLNGMARYPGNQVTFLFHAARKKKGDFTQTRLSKIQLFWKKLRPPFEFYWKYNFSGNTYSSF